MILPTPPSSLSPPLLFTPPSEFITSIDRIVFVISFSNSFIPEPVRQEMECNGNWKDVLLLLISRVDDVIPASSS